MIKETPQYFLRFNHFIFNKKYEKPNNCPYLPCLARPFRP